METSISEIKKYFIESERSEIFSIKESSYGYNRLVIHWSEIHINNLYLIIRCIILSERFKQLHSVTNSEIDLIHRCYFNVYNDEIWLDMKRPFGNSDIEGDISYIYNRKCDEQECSNIIDRIIYLIKEFLTDPLEPYDKMDLDDIEKQKNVYHWENDMYNYTNFMEGFDRKEKIKKILKDL